MNFDAYNKQLIIDSLREGGAPLLAELAQLLENNNLVWCPINLSYLHSAQTGLIHIHFITPEGDNGMMYEDWEIDRFNYCLELIGLDDYEFPEHLLHRVEDDAKIKELQDKVNELKGEAGCQ